MNLFGIHEQALYLRQQRADVLSSNIFNAATPGYKARDIDIRSALSNPEGAGLLRSTNRAHLQPVEVLPGAALFRVPTDESLDGNTVGLAYEQVQFAENAVRYQATLGFLNSRINTLRRALKGE